MAQPKFKTYKPRSNAPRQFTSWSFTRYNDWRRCPAFAKYKHLDKLDEGPKNEAMQRGADIAKASEDYLKGVLKRLPKELQTFKDHYAFFRKQKTLVVEENWGFDANWNPVAWNDWNNCRLRVKIDIGYQYLEDNSFNIRDGKTGKFNDFKNEEYLLQLELYAAAGVAMYPTVDELTTQLLYTDLGITFPKEDPQVWSRKEALAAQKKWDKRIKPMFADRTFAPRPGKYCQWCPFRSSNNGPCRY